MPLSHYKRYVPPLEVLLGTTLRSPYFVRVVHTTGGWPLIGQGFLIINKSRMTLLPMLVTVKQPPLTLTHLR